MTEVILRKLIVAIPYNGDLEHAIYTKAQDKGEWLIYGRALCGVRGVDAWGGGGFRPVNKKGERFVEFKVENALPSKESSYGGKINHTCPRCLSKARKIEAAG